MRTDQEILDRINEIEGEDFFGFETSDLVGYLTYESAKPFLKEGVTVADWTQLPRDHESVKKELTDYLDFAWDKANNCRGLSAGRSLDHMRAWLWMLGEVEFIERLNLDDYTHYGKPQLRAISERFGVDWRKLDNGRWQNSEGDEGVSAEAVKCVGG